MSFQRPDEDIRYVLTEKGRLDLFSALLEDQMLECSHTWEIVRRGLLCCIKCGLEHRPSGRSSSPIDWKH